MNNPVEQCFANFVARRLTLASKNNHQTWLPFHVHIRCLDDRYPKLNICTSTLVIGVLCLQYTRAVYDIRVLFLQCTSVMFTIYTCYVQNIHVLCSEYTRVMFRIYTCYVYNIHVLCLQYTRVMLTIYTCYVYDIPSTDRRHTLLSLLQYTFHLTSHTTAVYILYNWIVTSSATFSL
jgi:hypothetical protein